MNTIFGAGMTSKLFMNVRERMSLCYSIGSGYFGTKGILTVNAGIDFEKEEVTRQEILRQLDACKTGDITDEELTAAKAAILSSLRATHDSPGAIEGYYATAALSGMGLTPEGYMAAVEQVDKAAVVAAAKTVQLHSTYFLKGEN
jgi:predicted Zn-dependent peptidase